MENKCYLVVFESVSGQAPDRLFAAIKAYGTWAKITNNTWAIVTAHPATAVRDYLRQFIAQTDRIFVVRSATEAAWVNTQCNSEWLKKNL